MLHLTAKPLTAEAFAPFGDVIDARTSASFPINAGRTQRHHDLARVETLGDNARTLINVFVSQPVTLPLNLTFLERLTSRAGRLKKYDVPRSPWTALPRKRAY